MQTNHCERRAIWFNHSDVVGQEIKCNHNVSLRQSRSLMKILVLVVITTSLIAGGCVSNNTSRSSSSGANSTSQPTEPARKQRQCSASANTTPSETYALLDNSAWTLQQAIDPPADSPFALADLPPVDWYDVYDKLLQRGTTTEEVDLRISGHAACLNDAKALLHKRGFTVEAIEVKGWRAMRSTLPEKHPARILMLEHDDSVVMALSYALTFDELIQLAQQIKLVDRSEWIRAGGVVQ